MKLIVFHYSPCYFCEEATAIRYYIGAFVADDGNSLGHHGIIGQEWGVRNGPPYPLDAEDHSRREKKAGWRKSLDKPSKSGQNKSTGKNSETTRKGIHLSDGQKKALIVGAAVIGTGLLAYGAYKTGYLQKAGTAIKSHINSGKSVAESTIRSDGTVTMDDIRKQTDTLNAKLGSLHAEDMANTAKTAKAVEQAAGTGAFKKLAKPRTLEEAAKHANPSKSNTNCYATTMTCILQKLGFDVSAKSSAELGDGGMNMDKLLKTFGKSTSDEDVIHSRGFKNMDGVANVIQRRFKEGDCGSFSFGRYTQKRVEYWNAIKGTKHTPESVGGHVFAWSIENGRVVFSDGQKALTDSMVRQFYNADAVDFAHGAWVAKLASVGQELSADTLKALSKYVS